MFNTQLMQAALNDPTEYKKYVLTEDQRKILQQVKAKGKVKPSDLVRAKTEKNKSNMSNRLRRLYDIGYLDKTAVTCPTGGPLYVYSLNADLCIAEPPRKSKIRQQPRG